MSTHLILDSSSFPTCFAPFYNSLFKNVFLFLQGRLRGRMTERERSLNHWFTSQMVTMVKTEQIQSQEPGSSSRSPKWIQGSKALSNPILLPQSISTELDEKWSSQHMKQHPYERPVLSGGGLAN